MLEKVSLACLTLCHADCWIMHSQNPQNKPSSAPLPALLSPLSGASLTLSALNKIYQLPSVSGCAKEGHSFKSLLGLVFVTSRRQHWCFFFQHNWTDLSCDTGVWIFVLYLCWFAWVGSHAPLLHRLLDPDWSEMLTDSGVWFCSCYL